MLKGIFEQELACLFHPDFADSIHIIFGFLVILFCFFVAGLIIVAIGAACERTSEANDLAFENRDEIAKLKQRIACLEAAACVRAHVKEGRHDK